jgi:hypothetical protein
MSRTDTAVRVISSSVGQAGDAAAEAVVEGEFVEFFHVDVAGLVEVGDPSPLGGDFLDAAGEAVELGVEDFVVGGRLGGVAAAPGTAPTRQLGTCTFGASHRQRPAYMSSHS